MFEIKVTGIVQGVGFRPYVFNKAVELGLKGTIQNTGDGVKIVCDNKKIILDILKNPSELAKIDNINVKKINFIEFKDFKIIESENTNSYSSIPADLNICKDCLKELFDKDDFRYNYFFISCTNCGPRFSIINKTPYDRINTTLDVFEMCDNCKKEYENPKNRRYHAQTIACSNCGPKLILYEDGKIIKSENPVKKVADLIKQNYIVAIKGIGGFNLACNINDETVLELKKITQRYHKPFALMAKNLRMIEKYANFTDKEREILNSKKRPIVLLEKKEKNTLNEVSELSTLGFMLPYTALHYLLFEHIDFPIVLTSSNMPSHPITKKHDEQFVKYVLGYNREIANSVDDSIIKVIDEKPLIIRRSRGYAPEEIKISSKYMASKDDIFSMGGELKNTFCIKKNDKLIVSQHIGNTYNLENFNNFKETVNKLLLFTQANPKIILRDKNEIFNTSVFAEEFSLNFNLQSPISAQHHVAHGFSVAMEHNLDDFIAIVCDGTGLGDDGKVWGGEIFHNDKRIGHLEYQTLVGGDIANKEPLRMLVGILSKFLELKNIKKVLDNDAFEIGAYYKQKKENFNCIESSSYGRILDCVSVLLGFSDINYYEGRGAMLLESNSSKKVKMFIEPVIIKEGGTYILKSTPLFEFIANNLGKIKREELARFAQIYLAIGLYEIAKRYNSKLPIVFSGGVAYNNIITSFMIKNGVKINKEIPSGDGGISAGQIAYWLWKTKK